MGEEIVSKSNMSERRKLILAPMTCGKSTFVKRMAQPAGLVVDGDFPFSLEEKFGPLWLQFMEEGRKTIPGWGDHPWRTKDEMVLRARPLCLVTHQSVELAAWTKSEQPEVELIVLLPVGSPSELAARVKQLRPKWAPGPKETVLTKMTRAFEQSLKIAEEGTALRSFEEIDALADHLKANISHHTPESLVKAYACGDPDYVEDQLLSIAYSFVTDLEDEMEIEGAS